MPYIKQEDRTAINPLTGSAEQRIEYTNIHTAGDIQYAIAVMLKDFMTRKGLSYQNCNDVMGALDGASKEFYRRVVSPYEDLKLKENGDI